MSAAFVIEPDTLSRHANRDRLANLLIRLEAAPSMAWIHVLHAEGQARPVHLVIDGETHALSRTEADDVAAALFADPGILTDAAGLAARLMETARAGVWAANDNDPPPARPVRTGLSGLWLGAGMLTAYLATLLATALDAWVI